MKKPMAHLGEHQIEKKHVFSLVIEDAQYVSYHV
jgi:hypothetical protein